MLRITSERRPLGPSGQGQETKRQTRHSLVDSAITIEVAQAEADVVPVLRDVGRRAPHVPVHANIVQRVRATQPEKDKTQESVGA